jgi:hypothetical protein
MYWGWGLAKSALLSWCGSGPASMRCHLKLVTTNRRVICIMATATRGVWVYDQVVCQIGGDISRRYLSHFEFARLFLRERPRNSILGNTTGLKRHTREVHWRRHMSFLSILWHIKRCFIVQWQLLVMLQATRQRPHR